MIINHNLMAMNALRNANINNSNSAKSMAKLSSGLRINSASDDAAGLAISEKMRGQINGLDQASRNAQDGQSMIQTAEGALNETTSILQRMRELAVQAGNDTNVTVDRTSIQSEMNQLSTEINRIGNTTEFNTQKLLQGNGAVTVAKTNQVANTNLTGGTTNYVQATQTATYTATAAAGDTLSFNLNGQNITLTFATDTSTGGSNTIQNVTANSATINLKAAETTTDVAAQVQQALSSVILANSTLQGAYSVTNTTGATTTIAAVSGGTFQGAAGSIGTASKTGSVTIAGGTASVGTTTLVQATATIGATNLLGSNVLANGGEGLTINGTTIQFYDGSAGAYTGNGVGVDVRASYTASDVIAAIVSQNSHISGVTLTDAGANKLGVAATTGGSNGNNISVLDGGVSKQFTATFQVGANQGQQFNINIDDMRSVALGVTSTTTGGTDSVTGAKFTATTAVTNGTDTVLKEASLDVSTSTNATNAVKTIDNALAAVSAERAKLGAYSNRLDHTIANLGTTSENMSSAESRIRDVDMASEMMNYQKNNVLAQAAQAMISQANQQPQQVLQLLR